MQLKKSLQGWALKSKMSSKKTQLIFALICLTLMIIPFISAYSNFGWRYYMSPGDLLNNEWLRFAIILIIMFAIVFFAVQKTFKNTAVAGVIAIGVSLLISVAMAQQGLLYSYAGDTLGSIAILVGVAAAIFALIKVLTENFGVMWGTITGVVTSLIILSVASIDEIVPSNILYGSLGDVVFGLIDFIKENLVFVIIVAGLLIFFVYRSTKENEFRRAERSKHHAYQDLPDVIHR